MLSGLDANSPILKQFKSEFDKFTKKYKNDRISIELNFDKFDKHKSKKYKAELRSDIKKRVESFLDSLPSKPKNIIIVTHSGIMGVIQELLTGPFPDKACGDLSNGKNCSIMGITKTDKTFKLISFANTEHLKWTHYIFFYLLCGDTYGIFNILKKSLSDLTGIGSAFFVL